MDPLNFLHQVWEPQGKGFAFISLRRDDKSWRDFAFKFPDDELVLPDRLDGDLYFAPNLFSRPRRRVEVMLPSCWLYADLDEVDPREIDPRPTIAWESSPERFQALWHVSRLLDPELHADMNKKLTYLVRADKGGWDSTQVLRIPGTLNHKYAERPEVELLWA